MSRLQLPMQILFGMPEDRRKCIPSMVTIMEISVYLEINGTLKQKWETFTDLSDAKNRKKEVEYKESVGTFVVPQCKTLNDLLPEYVALYGKSKWALSTYQANTALIANYIAPLIGSMKLQDISTRVIEGYYQRLLKYEAADPMCGKRKHQFVSPSTVRSVHKILRSAFEQAVKWELMEKNPCIYATLPKYTAKKRDIWTAETLFHALEVCDDPRLRLCINLSFSCSLRLGELLGLTWDCVDISPESIEAGRASIYINKELQRVDIASLNALENKNVITRFPSLSSRCTTVQVLKSPKTDSSIRTIFLPKTVAEMLVRYKAEQDMTRDALGTEYADYNLVVAGPLGMPTEQSTINGALKQLIEENDLPKVVFHSFRHSSITYKLKLNGGDIKAVQGDSGHAQASMVTEQYAHILDDDRRLNAQRFDDFFYNIKFLFHCTLLRSRKVPCIQCLYSRKNTIRPFLLQDNAHFHSHCYIDQSFLAESSGLFLLKTLVHHTSYGCMDWFTNAKQANIRRETYTSQLMKGGHFTMNLPLFISSANFLLMKSLLLVLFRGLCSLLGLTAQQKIH
jgi:integrase